MQMQLQIFEVVPKSTLMAQYFLCFVISSAQRLTLEPAIPAVCLRQAWHCHTRTKTSSVVARETNREILSLKCYCCSDPAQQLLWKVSRDSLSVTAKMSNRNMDYQQPGSDKQGHCSPQAVCSHLPPLAEHPNHKSGSWTLLAHSLLRICCSTATCC